MTSGSLRGIALVAAQVIFCLILIVLGSGGLLHDVRLWPGVVLGVIVSASGVWAMRLSQVKLTPEPGTASTLCDRGIYHYIRHPMYAGLLLAFAMFAVVAGIGGWLAWLGLFAVLGAKMRIEESLWLERDPAYAEYRKKTKRLIPGVW